MESSGTFRKKVAIVTGASSGIGWATSLAFAREGASLVLIARSRGRLSVLADEIRAANGRESLVMPADAGGSNSDRHPPVGYKPANRNDSPLVNPAHYPDQRHGSPSGRLGYSASGESDRPIDIKGLTLRLEPSGNLL